MKKGLAIPLLRMMAIGALSCAAAAHAADYPEHAVTVVVPFGAGGSADVYTRQVAEKLRQKYGQPFVIENRVGAGSVVGTAYAARAKPDGYTLLTTGNAQLISESLVKNKPYRFTQDFVPVAPINEADLVLVVSGASKARTLGELTALAKSEPGKLNYSSAGTGTPYHLAGELFKSMAGIDVMHVPYKSSGEARSAVLGGEVYYMFDSVATMAAQIKEGRVHAIATTGLERSPILPDVPTLDELGLKGYRATILVGLVAPKGTPRQVVEELNRSVNAIIDTPDIKDAWAKQGALPMLMDADRFGRYLEDEVRRYEKIVTGAKISAQ